MKQISTKYGDFYVFDRGEEKEPIHPHIRSVTSGKVPTGKQRAILHEYLAGKGINMPSDTPTHYYVYKVLEIMGQKRSLGPKKPQKAQNKHFLPLTVENMEKQHRLVAEDRNYGKDAASIRSALNRFPENTDPDIVAMKLALIDVTNSTNLSRHKKKITLSDLAEIIIKIPDFDARLAAGDPELVNIIAKNDGLMNAFSLASKYCLYHNVEIYGRDDYAIFDSVVKRTLPHYVEGLTEGMIEGWRTTYDYQAFNDCITELLDRENIHIPLRRRKLDHFLWYANRG